MKGTPVLPGQETSHPSVCLQYGVGEWLASSPGHFLGPLSHLPDSPLNPASPCSLLPLPPSPPSKGNAMVQYFSLPPPPSWGLPPPANTMRWDIVVRTFMTRREEGRGEKGGKRNINTISICWRNRERQRQRQTDRQADRERVLILMHVFNSLTPLKKTREQRREERKKETERERM